MEKPSVITQSPRRKSVMVNLEQVKVTPRDQQVLNLLVQGCSNKEIAGQLNISPRRGKSSPAHPVFARRNPRGPQARVKLAIAIFAKEEAQLLLPASASPRRKFRSCSWYGRVSPTAKSEKSSHQRTSDQEPFAQRIRQNRCLEPSGVGNVRRHGGKDWPLGGEPGSWTCSW